MKSKTIDKKVNKKCGENTEEQKDRCKDGKFMMLLRIRLGIFIKYSQNFTQFTKFYFKWAHLELFNKKLQKFI